MHVRVLTLSLGPDGVGFDDEALVSFCAEHQVTEVVHHVVSVAGEPRLVFVLTWRDQEAGRSVRGIARSTSGRRAGASRAALPDLSPAEQARFETLKQWRNQHARSAGKPPYLIFNNGQAAAIAQRVPRSLAALGEIEGIGSSRAEAWGTMVLELLAGLDEDGAPRHDLPQSTADAGSPAGATDG